MRRKCVLLLVLILLLGSILVCPAAEFVEEDYWGHIPYEIRPKRFYDYQEYLTFYSRPIPTGFVYHENISFLGSFVNSEWGGNGRFIYRLHSGDSQVSFYTRNNWLPEKGAMLHDSVFEDDPKDTSIESSGENDLRRYDWAHRQYVTIENAEYHYFNQELCFIVFYVDDFTYYLEGDFGNYPTENAVNTFIPRLLNADTAPEAIAELCARLEPVQVDVSTKPSEPTEPTAPIPEPAPTPAWVLPTAIVGGAVVLAGAATATAVVIRRKKRKAAVADTPAEEENA